MEHEIDSLMVILKYKTSCSIKIEYDILIQIF